MMEDSQAYYRTHLIAQGRILQESWRRLLEGTSFVPHRVGSDLRGFRLVRNEAEAPDLVIFDLWGIDADVVRLARQVRSAASQARLVFVLDTPSTALLLAGFRAGANGFLDRDLSRDALISALRLVMLEQTIYPVACLTAECGADDVLSPSPFHGALSDRELQILRCLVAGESNKHIGKRLGITDTTVKVHLRNILQKIQVSNRTQAAIWAVSRGLPSITEGEEDAPAGATAAPRFERQLPA